MKYFIEPLSFLSHPELDVRNCYQTVVYNWRKQNILKVNRFGYEVLKILDEKPGLSLDGLCELLSQKHRTFAWQISHKVKKFIDQMVKENVIKAKN